MAENKVVKTGASTIAKMEMLKFGILARYKKSFIVIILLLFIVTIGFFLSEYYNINRTLTKLKIYPKYMEIDSKLHTENYRDLRLCDFYVSSSYRSCMTREQGYSSVKILREILRSGARFLWFDIFNEDLSLDTEPVISQGKEKGNWCYTGNLTKFDDCCKLLGEVAFTSKLVNNYNDPLIIALNLNVNKNKFTLEKIQKSLERHLGTYLLDAEYGYSSHNMATTPIKELMGKLVIFSSKGYENSTLEELINYSWEDKIRIIDNRQIDSKVNDINIQKIDKEELVSFNSNNLSIVVPNKEYYNILNNSNFNTNTAFENGCQFICMNYSFIDGNMDIYATKFQKTSFIPKPEELRISGMINDEKTLSLNKSLVQSKKTKKSDIKCPIKPKEIISDDQSDDITEVLFKDEKTKTGGTIFSTKCPKDGWKPVKNSLSLVLNEADKKHSDFKYDKVNLSVGSDLDGNQFVNWRPKMCSSTSQTSKIDNQYLLSPICHNPSMIRGQVGIKVHKKDEHKVPFKLGSRVGNYRWAHPSLCQLSNNKDINNGTYCVLSADKCPKDWRNNDDKDIILENNWKLCCRNVD